MACLKNKTKPTTTCSVAGGFVARMETTLVVMLVGPENNRQNSNAVCFQGTKITNTAVPLFLSFGGCSRSEHDNPRAFAFFSRTPPWPCPSPYHFHNHYFAPNRHDSTGWPPSPTSASRACSSRLASTTLSRTPTILRRGPHHG